MVNENFVTVDYLRAIKLWICTIFSFYLMHYSGYIYILNANEHFLKIPVVNSYLRASLINDGSTSLQENNSIIHFLSGFYSEHKQTFQ